MQLWAVWIEALGDLLEVLSTGAGLGPGLAIIALTVILRSALLPVSWRSAYSACLRQKRLKGLQPEIRRIKERFADQPQQAVTETVRLYQKNGLRFLDTGPIVSSLIQMPVLLGMFNVLREGWQQARFLWISNLSRPDFYIAVIAAATTALMVLANPDLPEQTRMLMILLPSVIAFIFALKFASALALYWVASNCFTAAQTFAVHYVVDRRIRSGAIEL